MKSIICQGPFMVGIGFILIFLSCTPCNVQGETTSIAGGVAPGMNQKENQGQHNGKDHNQDKDKGQDVGDILIKTVYISATPSPKKNASTSASPAVPEIEMKKLKAAAKGAGLSDSKADRVLRAVQGLDLKYDQVMDLKKLMINPTTSADYADRLRRALEDALVDQHQKNATSANGVKKTTTPMVHSDLLSPFSRSVQEASNQLPTQAVLQKSRPDIFFGTPLSAQGLSEDLDSLHILANRVLPRKDAFELVHLCYILKLSRAQVLDLQHEFAGGNLTPSGAAQLLQQLRDKAKLKVNVKVQVGANTPASPSSIDLSKPMDAATLQRLKTVAELSGLDKDKSSRLLRAVINSGLEHGQVHEIGSAIQSTAALPEDLEKLLEHLEGTDGQQGYRKRGLDLDSEDDSDGFLLFTPEQNQDEGQGVDWFSNIQEEHDPRHQY